MNPNITNPISRPHCTTDGGTCNAVPVPDPPVIVNAGLSGFRQLAEQMRAGAECEERKGADVRLPEILRDFAKHDAITLRCCATALESEIRRAEERS